MNVDFDKPRHEDAATDGPGQEEDVLVGEIVNDRDEPDGPYTPREAVEDLLNSPAAEFVLRQVGHVVVGVVVVRRRRRDRHTAEPYLRAMEAAKAIGDHDKALQWAQLARDVANDQHERRMNRVEAVMLYTPKAAIGTVIGVTTLGAFLAVGERDLRQFVAPWVLVGTFTAAATEFLAEIWYPALLTAPFIAVAALWLVGRNNVETSEIRWVRALSPASDGDPITPSVVVTALRDLGLAALRNAIRNMADSGAAMLSPIKIAGCGVEVDVTLPSGVSTEEVQNRRRKLAENLGRHEHELHITLPPQARTVRLWIADAGALDEPIGPSPLVTDPEVTADIYTGRAPWGRDLRGDAAMVKLLQRHVLITGISNQGKTAALRALALWLAFDPTVEFRIGDLKGVGDWRMFDALATVLIQGPTDEHVIAVTEMLEEAVEEMERRLIALEESGARDGVTRDMARNDPQFRPLVVIVDEAQVAFMCPAKDSAGLPYGGQKATSRYFMAARKLHNQGRVVNVTLHQGTQDPNDQNLPKLVREGAHIRGALALGTESQAKQALGETPVDAGAAPHKLRPGADKGTLVVAGDGVDIPAGQPSITIRTHYIGGEEAAAVAERAIAKRGRVATLTGRVVTEEPRDLLADIDELIRDRVPDERIRLAHLASLLSEFAPGYAPYAGLTGVALKEHLDACGITTTNTGNVPGLKPQDFHAVYTPSGADQNGK